MLSRNLILGAIPVIVLLASATAAYAIPSPNSPGQPSVEWGEDGLGDGPHGFTATSGFEHAETVYAGSDGSHSLEHANNAHAVSQYDVACLQLTK